MPTPYGAWRSTIGIDALLAGELRLGAPAFDGDGLIWAERRPSEGGRTVLVRSVGGERSNLTPAGSNVRSRVHEYGGGNWIVAGDAVVFSDDSDGRLRMLRPGRDPVAITPEPPRPRALRYADLACVPGGGSVVCVRESHGGGEPVNEVVRVALDGSGVDVLASGHDFFAAPRPSPDGRRLAWLSWDHPGMPWDGTELRVGDADASGADLVAGGEEESVAAPAWSPDGRLYFVSDRSDWWNLYRLADGRADAVAPVTGELAFPAWTFGMQPYAFLADGTIICIVERGGSAELGMIASGAGRVEPLAVERTPGGDALATDGLRVAYVGSSPTRGAAIVVVDPAGGTEEVVAAASYADPDPATISVAREISFRSSDGETAHALFYPPVNPAEEAPGGELPPLLVLTHGGPTGNATEALDLEIQFWTSRGLAVVDVNYRGSTGYGRAYRNRLRGSWGVVDLADCVAAAEHLAAGGEVDGSRLAIRGGSAGGYTTLCALTMTDAFAAGASYFGIGDAEALARDTHKFESRYLDLLIGPYPERADLYRERSPINHVDGLSCPVILFQGLEDEIVPPAQSERMAAALERKGIPYAYLEFEGEQHGLRKADSIRRATEAELAFYGEILGFDPADDLPPLALRRP